jgi:prepilin-type N-terminal cleavage/methylation domain-containing protein
VTRIRTLREDEGGFTLPEVLITTILLGILLTIATSTWFGVVESRNVDSATNQLAADLRLAHTKATNRLAQQTVTLTAGSSEYNVTGSAAPLDLDDDPVEHLVSVAAETTIVFSGNGEAQVTGANPVEVRSSDDVANFHRVEINIATSRIEIDP